MDAEIHKTPEQNGTETETSPIGNSIGPKTNGSSKEPTEKEAEASSPKTRTRSTRSRSTTPAKKNKRHDESPGKSTPVEDSKVLKIDLKKIEEEVDVTENDKSEKTESETKENGLDSETSAKEEMELNNADMLDNNESEVQVTEESKSKEDVDMDPLILVTDEPDPELQFDENSDGETPKGSPVISRCRTRRSHTRYVPTPKTPKSIDSESEKNSIPPTPDPSETDQKPETLDDTNDSTDIGNYSTKPQVGSGESSRLELSESHPNSILSNDDSYLNMTREKSVTEALRGLSARRSIRPINDYRKKAIDNQQKRSELNAPYPTRRSVESVTTGTKRKSRSITPEDTKKFKLESPGFVSLFSSPINSLKNKFRSEAASSTPKLTGYKDDTSDIHESQQVQNGVDEKRNWCTIM